MNFKFLLLHIFCFYSLYATERHALIIAIGNYPKANGWNNINAENDISLIKQVITNQDFEKGNVITLKNEEATYFNITNALKTLNSNLKTGDIVFIHFSGHGQPIWDKNKDEIDGYDEAWIPYDAKKSFELNVYEGENHLRDDELGELFLQIRKKLGPEGQLLVLMDSCHSGTGTRGIIGDIHRGSFVPFQPPGYDPIQDVNQETFIFNQTIKTSKVSPWVVISAAKAGQLNYEYNGFGSLSYAFSKAMSDLPRNFTYRDLFSEIQSVMFEIAPSQQPTIEGSGLDFKLFKNEYVPQKGYFTVTEFINPSRLKINAGLINGVFDGTTLKLCESGSKQPDLKNFLARGRIIETNLNEAIVELDEPISNLERHHIWVFVEDVINQNFALQIYLGDKLKNRSVEQDIKDFLREKKIGRLVTNQNDADLGIFLAENQDCYQFFEKGANRPLDLGSLNCVLQKELQNTMLTYAKGKFLAQLDLVNSDYSFEIKLLPVKYNASKQEFEGFINEKIINGTQGYFSVEPEKDFAVLQIQNNGYRPIYFTVLEINSSGKISSFLPNKNYPLTDEERLLLPGQKKTFVDQIFGFAPPYETLILKGFAANKPINFNPNAVQRGFEVKSYSLQDFFAETILSSRGNSNDKTGENKIEGFSCEFIYQVVGVH